MSEQAPQADWPVGKEGPLDVSVLFIDLVSSSEFASIMGLREYSEYVETFHRLCIEQCRYYFEEFLGGEYRAGGLDQAFRHGVAEEEESLPEVEPSVVASNIGTGQ